MKKSYARKYSVGRYRQRDDETVENVAKFALGVGTSIKKARDTKENYKKMAQIKTRLEKLDSQYRYHLARNPQKEKRLMDIYFNEKNKLLGKYSELQSNPYSAQAEQGINRLLMVDYGALFEKVPDPVATPEEQKQAVKEQKEINRKETDVQGYNEVLY